MTTESPVTIRNPKEEHNSRAFLFHILYEQGGAHSGYYVTLLEAGKEYSVEGDKINLPYYPNDPKKEYLSMTPEFRQKVDEQGWGFLELGTLHNFILRCMKTLHWDDEANRLHKEETTSLIAEMLNKMTKKLNRPSITNLGVGGNSDSVSRIQFRRFLENVWDNKDQYDENIAVSWNTMDYK